MEPMELKATWQMLEKALERENRMSWELLRQQKLDAVYRSLGGLRASLLFQIVFGVSFILLAALLWSTKPTALPIILAGVAVQAYGIGCIITASLVFASLGRIDYAAPVVEVQSGLARVQRAYGVCVVVAGLSWWFLWIPLLMVLAGLAHINLYAYAPSVIWIGIVVGVVGLCSMYGLYAASRRSSNPRFRQFMNRAVFGSSLEKAQQQLREVRGFEEELAA